ncbi:hypothetical protein BJF83_08140 [Nocardiopsis sp. CNR-923]|uniref:hypothetical protein n=1 Tax=Nocardiopsis sp. CNR-923 TaxID=1904965 RepID=UPI00095C976F|nr:hypothetical protein [Nocardiopsis sp. CNR-923]OLT30654.1 hypothetical protein BJF83_08140 [Nocardiopsis sp. CNR-923]
MSGLGFRAGAVLVFVCLLALWDAINIGWRGALAAALVAAIATGSYLFVLVGSLVTPLLVWGLVVAASLAATPYRGTDPDPEPAPDAPAMTWRPDDGTRTPRARA